MSGERFVFLLTCFLLISPRFAYSPQTNQQNSLVFTQTPEDLLLKEGYENILLVWVIDGSNASIWFVMTDEVLVDVGSWESGIPIIYDLSPLTVGMHNISIEVWDENGGQISDWVLITVFESLLPKISSPPDQYFDSLQIETNIAWRVEDENPSLYHIYSNGSEIQTGQWESGSILSIDLTSDNFTIFGIYNFTLVVFDISENFMTDTILIIVKTPMNEQLTIPLKIETILIIMLIIILFIFVVFMIKYLRVKVV